MNNFSYDKVSPIIGYLITDVVIMVGPLITDTHHSENIKVVFAVRLLFST